MNETILQAARELANGVEARRSWFELEKEVERLSTLIREEEEHPTNTLPDSILWALNSGDGIYRP